MIAGVLVGYAVLSLLALGAAAMAFHHLRQYRQLRASILTILNNVPGGIIIATPKPNLVLCNRVVADTLGLVPVEEQLYDLRASSVLQSICADLFDDPLGLDRDGRSFEIIDQQGRYHRWDRYITVYRVGARELPAILLADRTEMEQLTLRLEHSHSRDALTGLANRDIFHDRFGQALEAGARKGTTTAVLVIEIDQFSRIHEQAGWDTAKRVLVDAAARIAATTRASDTVARIGQCEFAVLLTDLPGAATAMQAAARFLEAAKSPPLSHGNSLVLPISGSIGMAVAPRDGSTSIRLLQNASQACRRAQRLGGGQVVAFDPGLDEERGGVSLLVGEMRQALETGQFFVEYQPIVDLRNREPTGFEALLRWRHPHRGMISPVDFVTAAEQSGFIHQLGDFVLRTACRDADEWPDGMSVSVNASVVQLMSGNWPLHLVELLADAGLVTDRLKIEITETASISSLARLRSVTSQLQRLGVRVMLDDFGTGRSSLSQLRDLSFDGLKIDRQFIYDLNDPRSREIVRMLVDYCQPNGLMIVAEGVETEAQVEQLLAMGCRHGQGFLLGRPIPQHAVLDMFARA